MFDLFYDEVIKITVKIELFPLISPEPKYFHPSSGVSYTDVTQKVLNLTSLKNESTIFSINIKNIKTQRYILVCHPKQG